MIDHKVFIINESGPFLSKGWSFALLYINYVFLPLLIYLFCFSCQVDEFLKDNNLLSFTILLQILPSLLFAFQLCFYNFQSKYLNIFIQSDLWFFMTLPVALSLESSLIQRLGMFIHLYFPLEVCVGTFTCFLFVCLFFYAQLFKAFGVYLEMMSNESLNKFFSRISNLFQLYLLNTVLLPSQ